MDCEKSIFRKVRQDLLVQEEDNATALLQSNNLGYINEVGSFLWKHCEGRNINQLYELLYSECKDLKNIPIEDVKKDIEEFMYELFNCGYILIDEGSDEIV